MPDGPEKMAVTFAGRLFRVGGLDDASCRRAAAAMVADWRRCGRDHAALAAAHAAARKREGPGAALMPLRNEWFNALKAGAEEGQFGYSAVVDLTMYYFNRVASANFNK